MLENKTIVVIGGSSGIGKEVARQAGKLGADLIIGGRDAAKLERVGNELASMGVRIELRQMNAHDRSSLEGFFGSLPGFDHLVSMIGDVSGGGLLAAEEETVRHVIESKFFTNLAIARLAVKKVRQGGSLLFTGGSGGSPSNAAAAFIGNSNIRALVEGLAKELAPGVRVNAVAPFWMETPFWRGLAAEQVAVTKKQLETIIPLGRTGTVEEVAAAYIFLMQNGFITGQQLSVDGGVTLG